MSRARRRLTTVDDPLEPSPPRLSTAAVSPPRPAATRPQARQDGDVQALFVRVTAVHGDALARAAFELRLHKQEIVAALLARHIDAHSADGLDAVRALVEEYRDARR